MIIRIYHKSKISYRTKCVLYDKGDKDGNKWYLKTPFYMIGLR